MQKMQNSVPQQKAPKDEEEGPEDEEVSAVPSEKSET